QRGDERIDEARNIPRRTPPADDPGPFIEHRRGDRRDKDGEDSPADLCGQQRQGNQDETGRGTDEKFVHRPPNRRSRAVKRSIASAKSRSEKSGHSFSTNISSA